MIGVTVCFRVIGLKLKPACLCFNREMDGDLIQMVDELFKLDECLLEMRENLFAMDKDLFEMEEDLIKMEEGLHQRGFQSSKYRASSSNY